MSELASNESKKTEVSQSHSGSGDNVAGDKNINSRFQEEVKSAVVGEGNIIYNYFYYRQEVTTTDSEANLIDDHLPCPYQGLYHFGPNDSQFFFGREVFIDELYQATQNRNFIPVLGASGSGKSSVVFAGLVPKLQEDPQNRWQFTYFRPGVVRTKKGSSVVDPFYALATALVPLYTPELNQTEQLAQASTLADSLREGNILLSDVILKIQQNHLNHRILLIADQFEELYTLCEAQTCRDFLDLLLDGINFHQAQIPSLVLVTTMRIDFLGNALAYPKFGELLRKKDIKIRAMNDEELLEVIVKPAQKLGVTFQDNLDKRIRDDVNQQPGSLPLLEFALTELWTKRVGKELTHEAYEEIGKVEGALARHADEKYSNLSPAEQEKVKSIFIQLVRPGEGAEDTRRIAVKEELGQESWALVEKLATARLVVTSRNTTDEETVEVVHEALIRNWGKLRHWMTTDRVFRAWQERLRSALRQWEETHQDSGSLLRGAALAEAQEQLQQRPQDLIAEKTFIEESIKEENRLKQLEKERQAKERRTAWGIAIGSLIAVVISGGLGLQARQKTKEAQLNLADSLARTSSALLRDGQDLDAFVEAIKAKNILNKYQESDPEVTKALMDNVYDGTERNRLQGHQDLVSSVAISNDGKTVVSGSGDRAIKIWDLATGKELRTLTGHQDSVYSVAISQDGKTLVSGSGDNTIKVWDLATGKELRTLSGHESWVYSVAISQDGKTLVSGSGDNTIKVWDLATGKELRTLSGHQDSVYSVAISNDGKTVVSGSGDNTIKVWDLATGKELRTLSGHEELVLSVAISNDGKTLVSGSDDNTIKIWDLATGKELRTLTGHESWVYSVAISNDGKTLVSGSDDNTIKIWDLATGKELRTLTGHQDSVYSVAISQDGKTLVSGSGDNTIKVWDLATGKELRTLSGHESWVYSVAISQDGKTLVSGSGDNTIKVWDLATGKELRTLSGDQGFVYTVAISNDGKTLVSVSDDKTIKIWNIGTDWLVKESCDWVANYLKYNPTVSDEDRKICDDI